MVVVFLGDKPLGGTELQQNWLLANLPKELADKVQIICRPEELDPKRLHVLWVQDMPLDVSFLADPKNQELFDRVVFVSAWQQMVFNINMGFPFAKGSVIKNAIYPIDDINKETDVIRLIYHPTPHRGLELLVPVFERIAKDYDNVHLDVFSNFEIYARGHLNPQYEHLYERCRNHPNITYHGSQPNDVVRQHLAKAHIFAYPSIWRETSCMSAMEAMSAKCLTVAPDYGALSETLANFNVRYDWTEDKVEHQKRFEHKLRCAIENVFSASTQKLLENQKQYADKFYDRNTRIDQWINFLTDLVKSK